MTFSEIVFSPRNRRVASIRGEIEEVLLPMCRASWWSCAPAGTCFAAMSRKWTGEAGAEQRHDNDRSIRGGKVFFFYGPWKDMGCWTSEQLSSSHRTSLTRTLKGFRRLECFDHDWHSDVLKKWTIQPSKSFSLPQTPNGLWVMTSIAISQTYASSPASSRDVTLQIRTHLPTLTGPHWIDAHFHFRPTYI